MDPPPPSLAEAPSLNHLHTSSISRPVGRSDGVHRSDSGGIGDGGDDGDDGDDGRDAGDGVW